MQRNNSNDQIKIDQETLNKYIHDYNLDSLLKEICSKERFEQLEKIQNYSNIIKDLNNYGGKELVEIFLNLPLKSLKALSEFIYLKSIIARLNRSGKKGLVREFLNFNIKRLEELSKFTYLWTLIIMLDKFGGEKLVKIFLNLPLESLEELRKNNFLASIIINLLECGQKELVEKFLNFDLEILKRLSEFNDLRSIINTLNSLGGKKLVEKFLNLDLKSLNFLYYLYNYSFEENHSTKELFTKFIDSDYHEFFNLLLSCDIKNKKEILSNFLIECFNFNPEDKIDYIFKFIKGNQEKPSNLNIFPFILGNIEFFKDDEISDIITIENLDNIINQLTKDNFKTFFDKEKIKNYIKQNPIFELIKDNINYNENTSIDNLIEIYLNKLFNEQECKDNITIREFNKNTTILDKSLENLIKLSGIPKKHLNNLIFESDILTLLNSLKNFKDPDLINFISNAINDRTTLDMIQKDINKYLEMHTKSNDHEKSKFFIQNIIATILFSPFILNIKITITEGIQSLEFNEFLKKIVSPIFKEVGINSEEDLLNFICEIDYLNQDSNKEYKVKFLDNKAFIISYLQKIFDLFKQETNMDVDSTQQFLNNNKIENQNQI